jgi:hypothetical protein
LKRGFEIWVPWLKPVILATQVAEIGRIATLGQPVQKVHKTTSQPMDGHCDTYHPKYMGESQMGGSLSMLAWT